MTANTSTDFSKYFKTNKRHIYDFVRHMNFRMIKLSNISNNLASSVFLFKITTGIIVLY